jgi:periplasmic protein TonB
MHEMHDRADPASPRLPTSLRSRAVVAAIIVIFQGAAFYFIAHTRASWSSRVDGPPMFAPAISRVWVPERPGITSRPWKPDAQEDLTAPSRNWKFPPIDLWPSAPGWSATVSEFTPVTEARPDPPDTQPPRQPGQPAPTLAPRRSSLRMVRWLRPVYSSECTLPGVARSVVLDLLIDPHGQPIKVTVDQSSGSPELDNAALHAANLWRFAPPLWKSQPIEVWGQVELRFNC